MTLLSHHYELSGNELGTIRTFLQHTRQGLESLRDQKENSPTTSEVLEMLELVDTMCSVINSVPITYEEDVTLLTDRWWEPVSKDSQINGEPVEHIIERIESRIGMVIQNESAFIAQCNGQVGILFEIEFGHEDSAGGDDRPYLDQYWKNTITTYDVRSIMQALVLRLRPLATQYPDVSLYVTYGPHVVENRIAVRAFVDQHEIAILDRLGEFENELFSALEAPRA